MERQKVGGLVLFPALLFTHRVTLSRAFSALGLSFPKMDALTSGFIHYHHQNDQLHSAWDSTVGWVHRKKTPVA